MCREERLIMCDKGRQDTVDKFQNAEVWDGV